MVRSARVRINGKHEGVESERTRAVATNIVGEGVKGDATVAGGTGKSVGASLFGCCQVFSRNGKRMLRCSTATRNGQRR